MVRPNGWCGCANPNRPSVVAAFVIRIHVARSMVKRTWHAWALWSIGVGSAACAVEPEDIVDEVEEAAEPRESAEGGPSAARTAPEPDREYRHPARRAGLRFDADRDIGEAMTFEDGVAGVQSGLRPSTSQHLTGEALRAYLP